MSLTPKHRGRWTLFLMHWTLHQLLCFVHHETNYVGDATEFQHCIGILQGGGPISLHVLKHAIFLLSCGPWKKKGGSPVDLEEKYHKFGRSLEYAPLGCHNDERDAVDQLSRECLNHSFFLSTDVLLLLAYLHIHRSIPCLFSFFNPMWRWWSRISNSWKFFLYFFPVSINFHYLFPWTMKTWTSFACYRPIPTFDLGYTEA